MLDFIVGAVVLGPAVVLVGFRLADLVERWWRRDEREHEHAAPEVTTDASPGEVPAQGPPDAPRNPGSDAAEHVRASTSHAMREVARLHLPSVRWRPVTVPGTSAVGLLGELVTPEERAQLEEWFSC